MKPIYKVRIIVCAKCGKTVEKRMPVGRQFCSLKCSRESNKPTRKTGIIKKCHQCGKEKYKRASHLRKSKNFFCSLKCANQFQKRNRIVFNCKICGTVFTWSKSRLSQANPTYCSIACRNKDSERIAEISLMGNAANLKKTGLNKLELAGNKILDDLGIVYKTQVAMFGKFIVDVLIESKNLVIQWDGEYWHSSQKRKNLDKSQDAYMKKCGYHVLRITDNDIKMNIKRVYDKIKKSIL